MINFIIVFHCIYGYLTPFCSTLPGKFLENGKRPPPFITFARVPRRMDNICQEWQVVADARESAYAKRQLRQDPRLTDRVLEELKIVDVVKIQNQTGNRPRKWYATGVIVGCLPHR